MRRAAVVFPQPVSPPSPRVSPRRTSNETPSTACTSAESPPKRTPRFTTKCFTRSRTTRSSFTASRRLRRLRLELLPDAPLLGDGQMAGDEVAWIGLEELRIHRPAHGHYVRAARMEMAAAGWMDEARRRARDRRGAVAGAGVGRRGERDAD